MFSGGAGITDGGGEMHKHILGEEKEVFERLLRQANQNSNTRHPVFPTQAVSDNIIAVFCRYIMYARRFPTVLFCEWKVSLKLQRGRYQHPI